MIEFLGELLPPERDEMMAGAFATLMLGTWPEPFGLVAIESLATGTPVIARRTGALPEIIEEGVDGFLVDDLGEAMLALDRIGDLDRHRDPAPDAGALLGRADDGRVRGRLPVPDRRRRGVRAATAAKRIDAG